MNMHPISKLIAAAARMSLLGLIALCGFALAAGAQSFSSGSDGSDGAFDLTGTPSGTTVTFVPANFPGDQHSLGIYNFSTITIPTGVTVRLSALKLPGPVIWLATGAVDIEGTVDLSGQAGYPPNLTIGGRLRATDAGAGGYAGGMGANTTVSSLSAGAGDGPGGGAGAFYNNSVGAGPASAGSYTGNNFLVPLVGGSGGGGGIGYSDPLNFGGSGGAGGGALLIASSVSITVNGFINASGGAGGSGGDYYTNGGAGSGGGIRLVTNTIAGTGSIYAAVIRLEAFNSSSQFSISGSETSDTPTGPLVLPTVAQPSITITSINSVAAPATPMASVSSPDVTFNSANPVTLAVQATNIPVGTVVTLHLYSDNTGTDQTVQTTPLAGTLQSSTATASVTFPSGYSMNYVKATWTSSKY